MEVPQKPIQDLEKQKLEIEIEILKHNLEKGKKESKNKKNLGDIIRKNIAILLAIISVVGGFVGIILPLNNYFEDKRKEMIPDLNNEIIQLVGKLNDGNYIEKENATELLRYYGLDAIPVILLALERSENNEAERLRLILTIKSIYNNNPSQVLAIVFNYFIEEFEKSYKIQDGDVISGFNILANYKELLIELRLSGKQIKALKEFMKEFEKKLPEVKNDEIRMATIEELEIICKKYFIDTLKINDTLRITK